MNILYIILILFILYILFNYNNIDNIDNFANSVNCKNKPELLDKIIKERQIDSIIVPCSYDYCQKDVLQYENVSESKLLFLLDGCDNFASKFKLWDIIRNKYGTEATKYMPQTFLLTNANDMKSFPYYYNMKKQINPNQMYVMKNYNQRQEGIKLTKDLNEIMNGLNNGWYLVQEYLYKPFTIIGHKINLRYYLLVVCHNGKTNAWIHNNGFVYYTPDLYDANNMDFKKHITTGYIDRKIYEDNPLTLLDYYNYLDNIEFGLSKLFKNNVKNLMNKVMIALGDYICKNKKLYKHTMFQLFGCDIAPSSNLDVSLMEINKGPSLVPFDKRDREVKIKVQDDIFNIVHPKKDEKLNNDFIKIY